MIDNIEPVESSVEEKVENGTSLSLKVALEEFRTLQTIIGNHETLFDRVRGWCMTLVVAMSIAYLTKDVELAAMPYIILSWFIIIFFAFIEAVHRVAHTRALQRSEEIEAILMKGGVDYDGPKIRITLKIDSDSSSILKSSNNIRFWAIWGSLFLIVLVVSLLG
ncbi:hypothetical protein [Vibrio diabolicus]|uniref:hypothetical protein n=1 Tax=Vibrio diabolicus TaxID=50719 RepID=UPI002940F2B4|nr:hypothetical protein [Vibrio diabolicus]MDV5062092.1 hypothetical protein [Vibrio diabolicus]